MKYTVHGPFDLSKKGNGLVDASAEARREFTEWVESDTKDLSKACGCYIFAVRAARGFKPWYVGITKRQSFVKECFAIQKVNYYNEALAGRAGTPVLFFIAKRTNGTKFAKPSKSGHTEMDFIEGFFIGAALDKNQNLLNVKKTKYLRQIKIPGYINSNQGHQGKAVFELKRVLR